MKVGVSTLCQSWNFFSLLPRPIKNGKIALLTVFSTSVVIKQQEKEKKEEKGREQKKKETDKKGELRYRTPDRQILGNLPAAVMEGQEFNTGRCATKLFFAFFAFFLLFLLLPLLFSCTLAAEHGFSLYFWK